MVSATSSALLKGKSVSLMNLSAAPAVSTIRSAVYTVLIPFGSDSINSSCEFLENQYF